VVKLEERIIRLLRKQNPWWEEEEVELPEFKRDLYKKIEEYMKRKQIIAIVGLRRIGKTILMKQIIQPLKNKKNVCYISFDDKNFQNYELAEDLINYFMELSTNGKKYLFLDEIQKLPNWNDLLKTYYDLDENLKIVISGSSSLELKEKKETLAGRIFTFHLPILTFKEFVRYHRLKDSISFKNILDDYKRNFLLNKGWYLKLFNDYLLKGAFPEIIDEKDEEFIKRYINESVIEKVIFDLSKQIKPKREDILRELLLILAKNSAKLFEIQNISSALKVDRHLISRFVYLLEKTFLIKISHNFTASVIKQLRVNRKEYLAHPSIIISLLDYTFDIFNLENEIGYLVETLVANNFEKLNFWRTPQKDEVDIIINKMPIEVKYRNEITRKDIKGLVKFLDRFKLKEGYVITKDILKGEYIDDKRIMFIPAWLFLLTELNEK